MAQTQQESGLNANGDPKIYENTVDDDEIEACLDRYVQTLKVQASFDEMTKQALDDSETLKMRKTKNKILTFF